LPGRISLVIAGSVLCVAAMRASEMTTPACRHSPQAASSASRPQQDAKWYEIGGVGLHILDDKIPPEPLSDAQALAYFKEGGSHLSELWRAPENQDKVAKSLQTLKTSLPYFNAARSPTPFALPARFNASRVVVRVLAPLGGYLWHNYFETLAVYEFNRRRRLDDIFNLVATEKRLSFTFKGIGHGTPAGYFSSPDNEKDLVTKALGVPDDEYMSQTPSYRLIYYRRYNISIEIHDGVVYAVERGKPGWVER
jgi:hypothetical protein